MGLSHEIPTWVIWEEISLSIFFVILGLFCLFYYQSRRHLFPINGCDPVLLLIGGYFTVLGRTNDTLVWWTWFPCQISTLIRLMASMCSVFAYLLRAWTLLFRFQITSVLLSQNVTKLNSEERTSALILDNWYVRHRSLVRPSLLALFFIANISISLTLYLLDFVQEPNEGWCPLEVGDRFVTKASRVHVYILGVMALALAYKLAKVTGMDVYGVKRELFWCSINMLFWQMVYSIWSFKVGVNALVLNGFDWWYRVLAALPFLYWSYFVPIYRSYQWERKRSRKSSTATGDSTLAQLLADEEGVASLLAYLKKEFSTENLLFYLNVSQWLELAGKHPALIGASPPAGDQPTPLSPTSSSSSSPTQNFFASFQSSPTTTPPPTSLLGTTFPSSPNKHTPSDPLLVTLNPLFSSALLDMDDGLSESVGLSSSVLPLQNFLAIGAGSVSSMVGPTLDSRILAAAGSMATSSASTSRQGSEVGEVRRVDAARIREYDAELEKRAHSILEVYLKDRAKFAINLSDRNRKQAIRSIEEYGHSGRSLESLRSLIRALEDTKTEIFTLIEHDSFRRYILSPEYQEYQNLPSRVGLTTPPQALKRLSLICEEEKQKSKSAESKSSLGGPGGVSRLDRIEIEMSRGGSSGPPSPREKEENDVGAS